MKIDAVITRQKKHTKMPYTQRFTYEYEDDRETVASLLTALNKRERLTDADGGAADPIDWECGCLQKKCGACAMVINGRPSLACSRKLTDCGAEVALSPMRKFPVVADLRVDRSALYRNLEEIKVWLEKEALKTKDFSPERYEESRCLLCGCCLEVCPNFIADGDFVGMAAAVPVSRVLHTDSAERRELIKQYRQRIFEGCGKSLYCMDICPAGIDTGELLARSNAAAVWGLQRRMRNDGGKKSENKNETAMDF